MASLVEKVALVTGGARGIGRAIAQKLAQEGATVVINYSHSADTQEVVSAITAQGEKAIATQADISRVTDISRLFQEIVKGL